MNASFDESRAPRLPSPEGATPPSRLLAELVNSVVGSQPLNKQPLLIADILEEELLRLGWPVGLRIGGEPELAQRYGVGRDVLREVVRLLEARGHVRMRRGPGGGMEIVQPNLDDLIGRFFGYAYVSGTSPDCVMATWLDLQAAAARLMGRGPDRDWAALGEAFANHAIAAPKELGTAIIAASGNPVLVIIGELIGALLPPACVHPVPNDADALLRTVDGAPALLDWLRSSAETMLQSFDTDDSTDFRIDPPPAPQSACFRGQAMQLVHDLMTATSPEQWRRGTLIGNEFDLADRFGVDKSVVRQAIRLMEDAETATSLPGRGRGLVTRLPSTAPLSRLLCAFFVAHQVTAKDGEDAFLALRIECAGSAAQRATQEDKATLLAMLHDLKPLKAPLPVSALQCFERLQQHVAHNNLLSLSIDAVKAFLTWRMATWPVVTADILETYKEHTTQVVAAICTGDTASACEAEVAKLVALSTARAV